MFGFLANLFNRFRQERMLAPSTSTFTFANTKGQRISVQLDPSLSVGEVVARLNQAAGDISWRISSEGRAEYIASVDNCPMRRRM